ncbi:MAG: stage III sporulation protein AB [Firmicutes bacterium]|nr:stage III sporulation protein AB [Bacillota bacterium]MCL1944927.1 stage III sporulation protein AB [Bacillota bacterium]MCL1954257.1 stage III sporulation protein AB [Bacillota bacterium]
MNFVFIIFLTAICGSMIGLYFYNRQKARLDYYYELMGLVNSIISDVRFKQDKLNIVFSNYLPTCKSALTNHITQYLEQQNTNLILSKHVLKKTELPRIERFFSSLGHTDSGTQLLELEGYKQEFEQDLKRVKAHHDKYGTTSIKLGFALGIGLGIMFI